MKEIFDSTAQYLESKKKLRQLIVYYFVFSFVILGALLTFFLISNDNYLLPLIINIVLTIIFAWGSIYFFTNPFKILYSMNTFFRDLDYSNYLESVVVILSVQKRKAFKYGLEFFVYEALEKSENTTHQRNLYVLELDENIVLNKTIKIKTIGNILVAYEDTK